MPISGYFTTESYSYVSDPAKKRCLIFSWYIVSQGQDSNGKFTKISYELKGDGTTSGYVPTKNINLKINGTTVFSLAAEEEESVVDVYYGTVLCNGEKIIYHTSSGDGTFEASAECFFYNSKKTGSSSWVLPKIQASTITVTDGYIGKEIQMKIKKANPTYTHTVTITYGGSSWSVAENTSSEVINYTIPTGMYPKIPNDKYAIVEVMCTTFNANRLQIGQQFATFKAKVEESSNKPQINTSEINIYDSNRETTDITGDNSKFIKGLSSLTVSRISASGKNFASISSLKLVCGGTEKDFTNGTATIDGVAGNAFNIVATDSRGFTSVVTGTITLIDYFTPWFLPTVKRSSDTGNTLILSGLGSFCANGYTNKQSVENDAVKVEYQYKETGEETWSSSYTIQTTKRTRVVTNIIAEEQVLTNEQNVPTNFDYTKSYDLRIIIRDRGSSSHIDMTIGNGVPVFDWGKGDFNFNVPVNIPSLTLNDSSVSDFVIEQVEDETQVYRKWKSGYAEWWCTIHEKPDSSGTFLGGKLYNFNDVYFPGGLFTSTPTLFVNIKDTKNGGFLIKRANSETSKSSTGIYALVTNSDVENKVKICFYAFGKWKN